jgi:DNA-binding MarR family transcriptional regulator
MKAQAERPFLKSPGSTIWIRLLRLHRMTSRHLEEKLQPMDLTLPQFHVLATLGFSGELAFNEIGQKLMVTVGNLTGIVDRLEEKRLVSRERESRDRRVIMVRLTPKGKELYTTAKRVFEQTVLDLFSVLDKSNQRTLSLLLRSLTVKS